MQKAGPPVGSVGKPIHEAREAPRPVSEESPQGRCQHIWELSEGLGGADSFKYHNYSCQSLVQPSWGTAGVPPPQASLLSSVTSFRSRGPCHRARWPRPGCRAGYNSDTEMCGQWQCGMGRPHLPPLDPGP